MEARAYDDSGMKRSDTKLTIAKLHLAGTAYRRAKLDTPCSPRMRFGWIS